MSTRTAAKPAPPASNGPPAKRRRRSPELAEREILAAAEEFLRERPFRELTVDEVMARTTMSRPSFYVYFRDRHQLAVRLVEGIGRELFEMANRWFGGTGDPLADMRAAIEGVTAVYAEHGLVLGAIADAAGHDPEVEATYHGLIERFCDAAAEHVGQEIAAGSVTGVDAREVGRALVWMNERYLKESLGRRPQAEPDVVVRTLFDVWVRTLYGTRPA